MGGVIGDPSRVNLQAPAVRLCQTAGVAIIGVVIHAVGHPGDRRRVCNSGGGDRNGVPPGTILASGRWSPGEGNHLPSSEAGGAGPPRSDAYGP